MRTTMANDDIESGVDRSEQAAAPEGVRMPPPNTPRTPRSGGRARNTVPVRVPEPERPADQAFAPETTREEPAPRAENGRSSQEHRSGQDGSRPHQDGNRQASRDAQNSSREAQNANREAPEEPPLIRHGVLEILPEGWGFLRQNNFDASGQDVYVAQAQIKRFGLKTGDTVSGAVRPPKDTERYYGLLRVENVNSASPDQAKQRPNYEELVPIYPEERLVLETDPKNFTARVIDLIAPIGKGQRAIVVAPPKAGKTTILKSIANSITANHPEVTLMVLLIDERPEEVTDIRRSVHGEVISSTFDELPENHMRVADMVLEKAKRQVESGKDVVVLLDSLTRLSRASNLTVTPSGRTLQGGLDPAAIYRPKRFFGAARNIEGGGSLTIIATALVETGSRMDDIIFEEFKGTGNSELKLDREIANRRIFPAINVKESSTRKEELLYDEDSLKAVYQLHRVLAGLGTVEATELLIDRLSNSKSNKEFLKTVSKTSRRDD